MALKKKAARNTAVSPVVSTSKSDGAPESQGAEVAESGGGAHPRRDGSGTAVGFKKDAARANGSGRVGEGSVDSGIVRGECEKALVALRRGNSTKALRLIKEACTRHEASGVAHRVQGHIFMRLAAVIEDANAKQRHFAAALESARRAASLSSHSVEYAHFYAQLLLEAAKDSEGYREVVRECERALRIEQPVDPARESLHSEQQSELPTAEARVAHVHQELKALVQTANISSISTWMKTLGTDEDKLRFVQMRKFADQDPMEQRVSQPKRPNEVKKIVKTPKERRQEIEVRVAATKLLQQRGAADAPEDHEKSFQKKLEKRKSNARKKPLAIEERIDRVCEFWRSLSQEEREMKLVVAIPELKEHASSGGIVMGHAASDALSEALEFAQERQTWRFWACCKCGERLLSFQELSQHTWEEHLQSLPEKLQQVVPHEITPDWAEQLLDEDLCPFDGVAAVRELVKSAPANYIPADLRRIEDIELGKEILGKEIPSQDLPLAEDEVRKKLLEKIYSLFRALIRSKYLAQDHVAKIITYAMEEIQALVPDPGVHYELNQSPMYIRFLDPQPLLLIEKYLMELAEACGVSAHAVDSPAGEEPGEEIIQDRLFLSEDFSQLLLDERVVKEFPEEVQGEEECAAPHRSPLALMKGKDAPKHVDLQLSWIFGATEYEFPPPGWKQLREDQGQRGRDVFRVLETEFQQLYSFCDKKYEYVCYEEALSLVERLCVEENRRRELLNDGSGKRFETVLRDRQQELLELRSRVFSAAQKVELDAITNVLRDASAVMIPRQPDDDNLGIRVSDLDEAEDEAWRMQESLPRADSRVEHAILRQKEHLSTDLNHLDAKIMKAKNDLQKLEIKLGQLAVLDYRAVVLPLVKSLLQSRLEGDTEKDALQKSVAASEAFLAELAKDKKSSGSKESENQKQGRDKSKEKKKGKKFKDVKRGPSNSEQESEAVSVEADEVDDADNWDWPDEDDLLQQRDSEIHQTLLWEEERKLLEALESQRRLEEEAKQRHLNEQERKKQIAQQVTSELLEDGKITSSPTSSTVDDVGNPIILPTSSMQLSLVGKNRCQDPAEVTVKKIISLVQTNDPLLAQIEEKIDCRRCENVSAMVSELEIVKVSCQSTFEELGAGKDALLSGDGDHFNAVQRKTRENGNRPRRRRGSRIYAEEGMTADRDAQRWKTPTANDPRTSSQQYAWKENGKLSTTDKSMPLSRQNGSRSFGAAPANGVPAAQPPSPEGAGEHEGKKTLRQLQAEQDDEERYQAEMELAMRQSLDMLTPQRRSISPTSSASSPSNAVSFNRPLRDQGAQQMVETGTVGSLNRAVETPLEGVVEVGKGLRNEIGQYNCFLNVVIQSLWHLRRFREDLLAPSSMLHAHVGSPCVVCALRDIFLGLDTPVNNSRCRDAVAPTALRVALSALYSDSDFFQEAQMNDASEVLAVIFECLHKAFVPNSSSDGDSESSMAGGSWDCQGPRPCMVHALFGLDVAEQMNCQYCGLESRHLKYTTLFHNINASALRTAKVLYQECSMEKLLKLVDMNHQLACDTETGGCGRQNHTHHLLHAAPSVFTTVLGWQNGRESFEDISSTVDAMDVSLDVGVIYRGLDEGFQHRLVSVVCYYGQHYHCFAYNQELGRWVMFDDSTVKVIGEWRDVASTCRKGHLQPQVLFYEAVH